jgi:hypothetical protein
MTEWGKSKGEKEKDNAEAQSTPRWRREEGGEEKAGPSTSLGMTE